MQNKTYTDYKKDAYSSRERNFSHLGKKNPIRKELGENLDLRTKKKFFTGNSNTFYKKNKHKSHDYIKSSSVFFQRKIKKKHIKDYLEELNEMELITKKVNNIKNELFNYSNLNIKKDFD